jgi:hypothetical protein
MIKDKYEMVSKAEKDRLVGTTLIPSYGKLPVKNEGFNKLIQYLEKLNKQLQVPNPSKKQKGLQDAIETQLNLERLKILDDHLLRTENVSPYGDNLLALLAFRNWCGMGTPIYTNIKNDLDNPSKMFKIDRICRDHDIRYTKAKTTDDLKEADNIMMVEILEEYVINFKKNFITGNYDTDFSTWSSTFTTFYNQALSFVEAGATIGLMGAGVKTIGEVVSESNKLIPDITRYTKLKYNQLRYYGRRPDVIDPFVRQAIENLRPQVGRQVSVLEGRMGTTGLRLMKDAGKLLMTTIIRDKLLAITGLIGIGLKTAFEWFFKIDIAKPWQHDVTEEQFNEIIRVFELLQNEYLTDSDLEPVKVGNEWMKEELIFPSIPTLEKELTEIFIMNKTYIEKRFQVVENEPEPPELSPEQINLAKDITDMLITDPVRIQNDIRQGELNDTPAGEPITYLEPLTKEDLIRLDEYKKFNLYLQKIFNEDNFIISPYPDLPSTDTVKEKEKLAPDIEKDIKEATPSSLLDLPDEENIDDEKIKQNEINRQKENDEKNKTEL